MQPGRSYFVRVFATNGAGGDAFSDAPPVAVVTRDQGIVISTQQNGVQVRKVVVLVAALVGAISAAAAVATFYLARERYSRRQRASRKQRSDQRTLRTLLTSLVQRSAAAGPAATALAPGGAPPPPSPLRDVAFVITDLEGSTAIAAAAPRAYEFVQQAHDSLLRDLIAAFGGYEINTEGDAFHAAFPEAAAAVRFCLEVQYQMMEVDWPRGVLRAPACRAVAAPGGGWAYRGPRVRMGVHWAGEGSAAAHVHALTKHRVDSGPAFQVTRDLCEAAAGGQVLLSHAAWERLRGARADAAFPVVSSLGCYKLPTAAEPVWVYEVLFFFLRPLLPPLACFGAPALGVWVR